jgi:hypothetical protein
VIRLVACRSSQTDPVGDSSSRQLVKTVEGDPEYRVTIAYVSAQPHSDVWISSSTALSFAEDLLARLLFKPGSFTSAVEALDLRR